MNVTNIEWVMNPDKTMGMTVNPVSGKCLHGCEYCYADRIRKRYGRTEKIEYFPNRLKDLKNLKKPTTIFVGSMHDLFGNWVNKEWIEETLETCSKYPQHYFQFLTKNGKRMKEFARAYPMTNFWYGQTLTGKEDISLFHFVDLETENSFISYEPLIGNIIPGPAKTAKWIIIGSWNSNYRPVPAEKGGTKIQDVMKVMNYTLGKNMSLFIKPQIYELYKDLPVYKQVPFIKAENKIKQETLF